MQNYDEMKIMKMEALQNISKYLVILFCSFVRVHVLWDKPPLFFFLYARVYCRGFSLVHLPVVYTLMVH